ncbi:ADP-ribosylglycohydrolase family protein [Aeromonas veronii]|uniref:ADP-ribosylglycohydrolase family protein n=1 Tax=Aeromonas veronii TaxID=654 RepID=UPI001F3F7E55|nr:ADP-ribosylglycohydrolase family protein [Aeromonas veronii]MCF5761196.1 ADP-ribosylglycohydrolase family protein [Aeromonas veronii]MCO4171252.1 ADP-ribosylglycohydrolase family protein [Aeromonas veronii]
MSYNRLDKIVNSALWAAYGDAMGFMTELAQNVRTVETRIGTRRVTRLVEWKRLIGGRFGAEVTLPIGAYSDDTQLRLATSRSITGNGTFDLHTFSKIEIPVWQSYALGAGIGSKVAANFLSKRNNLWFNNIYKTDKADYFEAGGNGACMRIQPHVWSSSTPNIPSSFLDDVIKNSLTTHGHPRAIAGSVFHALSLAYTMNYDRTPSIDDMKEFSNHIIDIPAYILKEPNLDFVWSAHDKKNELHKKYIEVHKEILNLIDDVEFWLQGNDRSYRCLSNILNLDNPVIRGSGVLTAVAASAVSLLYPDKDIHNIIIDIVNELGTDTDSIATMAGAILGILNNSRPPQSVQDESYIVNESNRLFSIAEKRPTHDFNYFDALNWKSPNSPLDYITTNAETNQLELYPFGTVNEISEEFPIRGEQNNSYHYQWVKSTFGQSYLVKKRNSSNLRTTLKSSSTNSENDLYLKSNNTSTHDINHITQYEIPLNTNDTLQITNCSVVGARDNCDINLDQLTHEALSSNFNPEIIGKHILMIADSPLGTNGVIGYAAIISKARVTRREKYIRS